MSKRHAKSEWLSTIYLSIAVAVLAILASYLAPFEDLDHKITDQQMMLRDSNELSDSPIVIVEISQEADEEIPYQYPWPRWIYAKLIENLNQAGAKAIAIDVLFDQRDQNPANDSTLAETLREFDNVVLIGGFRRTRDFTNSGLLVDKINRVMPAPVLQEAMQNPVGIVDMHQDSDGFIRSYPFGSEFNDEQLFSLAVQTLMIADSISRDNVYDDGDHYRVGNRMIPKNNDGMMYINYYGGSRTFPYIGFEKIVDDEEFDTRMEMEAFSVNEFSDPEYGVLAQGVLKDKIVFVGSTMPELQDFHLVPITGLNGEPVMAGVEIHAHALQSILDENYLKDVEVWQIWLFALFFAFLIVAVVQRFGVWLGLAIFIFVMALILLGSQFMLNEMNMVTSTVPLLLSTLGAYFSGNVKNYLTEQKQKERITSMFSSYVSPELVNRLIKSDERLELKGESRELTVLFSDIANFSKLSESIPAEKVVVFMNEYLGRMTKIITDENGTLDKYIGDAVMAFYGAPVTLRTHAARACRSALFMQKASLELSSSTLLKEQISAEFDLHTRIGINTGEMVVGNMGSSQRFNYTVMGDQVNIGARCETVCKEFGVGIIVTKNTRRAAGEGEFVYRHLGRLIIKGRKEPVDIYHLVSFAEDLNLHLIEIVEKFNEGIEHFLNRDWKVAADIFRETKKAEHNLIKPYSPLINPSVFYLKRCRHFQTFPPPESWQGAVEQQVK
jgi:adenylate cyclase